jgi:hypothetical protein
MGRKLKTYDCRNCGCIWRADKVPNKCWNCELNHDYVTKSDAELILTIEEVENVCKDFNMEYIEEEPELTLWESRTWKKKISESKGIWVFAKVGATIHRGELMTIFVNEVKWGDVIRTAFVCNVEDLRRVLNEMERP